MAVATTTADRLGSVSTGAALELRGVTKLFGALSAIADVTMTRSKTICSVTTARAAGETGTMSPYPTVHSVATVKYRASIRVASPEKSSALP